LVAQLAQHCIVWSPFDDAVGWRVWIKNVDDVRKFWERKRVVFEFFAYYKKV
jgi:hypothetical protein